ncbi:MAG: hypothetical protein WBG57_13440 [Ornithinimicrobium sp.]
MSRAYIKQRLDVTSGSEPVVSTTLRDMLARLRQDREGEASRLAHDFGEWEGPIVVPQEAIKAARSQVAP